VIRVRLRRLGLFLRVLRGGLRSCEGRVLREVGKLGDVVGS